MIRRVFWMGVGATITVVIIVRGRKYIARYAPASLVERVETTAQDLGTWFSQAVADFKTDFTTAFSERETELLNSLLAEGQDDFEALAARRDAFNATRGDNEGWGMAPGRPERAGRAGHSDRAGRGDRGGRPSRGVDLDEGRWDEVERDLGYSF